MKPQLSFEDQTQAYSTWGDKLLQHADRLNEIQNQRMIRPITIQLAPTELCDSDCPFCSVQNRPIKNKIPFEKINNGLREFKELGAKSLELTGGGNPLLYRDGQRTINDVIELAYDLGLEIGVITNSENPSRFISEKCSKMVKWIRVSMIKLDEGKDPADYNFNLFNGNTGISYIIYEATTPSTIERIAEVVSLNPHIKFVRIAANCLTEESITIKEKWGGIISAMDKRGKMFIKEIGENFHAYPGGCWVGAIRPYWVHDGVYICTSHVLIHRTYNNEWKLCGHDDITATWNEMNARFAAGEPPYKIDIAGSCKHCYYAGNNKILATVINELPDKNFA